MTLKHLQLSLDNMMSLQEVSPVKTSVWQDSKKASQSNPDQVSFTNSSESYAWYDQSSSSWKTWQRSLITDWTSFSESFPKQGTMQNGQLYLQVHWEPAIEDQGGGSLPTPSQRDYKGGCGTVKEKDGKFYRQSNTTGTKYGVRLDALMEYKAKKKMPVPKTPMLPTPTASDVEGGIAKDVQFKNGTFFRENQKGEKKGVKLRDAISMLPTPTAMDTKDNALKNATKLLQGKTHRSSGQPIQVTLSDKVMMEMILKNPELMKIYQDHQMEERPYLPPQEKFVTYLRQQTTIKELVAKTTIKKTTIEHWFRKDKAGFSYPSIENWEEIKPHLKTIQFDMEMTTVQNKEWTTKSQMLPTPTTMDYLPQRSPEALKKQMEGARKGRTSLSNLREAVNPETQEMFNSLLPTPTASEHKARMKDTTQAGKCLSAMARRDELSTQTGGNMFLNPYFVEEMMGYEVGWTDLRH